MSWLRESLVYALLGLLSLLSGSAELSGTMGSTGLFGPKISKGWPAGGQPRGSTEQSPGHGSSEDLIRDDGSSESP
jgi:hypothetical protein